MLRNFRALLNTEQGFPSVQMIYLILLIYMFFTRELCFLFLFINFVYGTRVVFLDL